MSRIAGLRYFKNPYLSPMNFILDFYSISRRLIQDHVNFDQKPTVLFFVYLSLLIFGECPEKKPIVYPLLNKYIHLLSTIPSSQVGRADVFERKNDEYFLTRIYYLITFKAFITLSQHDCRSLHFLL